MKHAVVLLLASLLLGTGALADELARGTVFHDVNGNGRHDEDEPGVAGVLVSNGLDVVKTGPDGRYEIPVDDDTIVFVNKPRNWMTAVDGVNTPAFYYIHKPEGSPDLRYPGVPPTGPLPASIDFPLYPREEPDTFRALFFGDTQPRNQREIDWIAHDVLTELIGAEAMFGVILGDLVFDDLSMFEPLKRAMSVLEVPVYYVIGNHDIHYDVPGRRYTTEAYEQAFGPAYHAYAVGRVHFLVTNNIEWLGDRYIGRFGDEQLAFFENYLAEIPKDSLVIPMMHIPLMQADDKARLLAMLAPFENSFSASAHWHRQTSFFLGDEDGWDGEESHHHLVAGTVCGSWWSGVYDELGIPHTTMADGVPNGYLIVTFDGTDYRIEYKVARRPAEYQMNIYTPDGVSADDLGDTEVVVNVFMGTERSTVDMRIRGTEAWTALERVERMDPYYLDHKAREQWLSDNFIRPVTGLSEQDFDFNRVPGMIDNFARRLPVPRETPHLWTGTLPEGLSPGTHVLEVRTTDMFGQTYTARRVLRVED